MIDTITEKVCTGCNEARPVQMFARDQQKKSGLASQCKPCMRAASAVHYTENKGYYRKRSQDWRAGLSDEQKRQRYQTTWARQSTKEYAAKWQRENKEKIADYKRLAVERDPSIRLRQRERYKDYRRRNPEIFAKHSIKRRKLEKQATPTWLNGNDEFCIRLTYLKRDFITEITGIPHQVDHVFPLNGKDSCGLHVPWNLRVISATENRRKNNKLPNTYD